MGSARTANHGMINFVILKCTNLERKYTHYKTQSRNHVVLKLHTYWDIEDTGTYLLVLDTRPFGIQWDHLGLVLGIHTDSTIWYKEACVRFYMVGTFGKEENKTSLDFSDNDY